MVEVRQLIGPNAGQIVEMPHHVAEACKSAGTAQDPDAPLPRIRGLEVKPDTPSAEVKTKAAARTKPKPPAETSVPAAGAKEKAAAKTKHASGGKAPPAKKPAATKRTAKKPATKA